MKTLKDLLVEFPNPDPSYVVSGQVLLTTAERAEWESKRDAARAASQAREQAEAAAHDAACQKVRAVAGPYPDDRDVRDAAIAVQDGADPKEAYKAARAKRIYESASDMEDGGDPWSKH